MKPLSAGKMVISPVMAMAYIPDEKVNFPLVVVEPQALCE